MRKREMSTGRDFYEAWLLAQCAAPGTRSLTGSPAARRSRPA